jgi:ribonuclease HI
MEMLAIIKALQYLQKNHNSASANLHSDSNLLVQSINLGWKRKANLDLWQDLDKSLSQTKVKFNWVKAHHQNQFNNLCDELAQSAARKALKRLKASGKSIPAKTPIKKAPPKQSQAEQSSLF